MFSPSPKKKKIRVLRRLLTSAAIYFSTRAHLRLRLPQISPGKNDNLHPMYLPHLPHYDLDSFRASSCRALSPSQKGLICDFCSSGQGFASSFLQTPSHEGRPCSWLALLAVKRASDLNRLVIAHAGRTLRKPLHLRRGFSDYKRLTNTGFN